jgi:hypothetical protein
LQLTAEMKLEVHVLSSLNISNSSRRFRLNFNPTDTGSSAQQVKLYIQK